MKSLFLLISFVLITVQPIFSQSSSSTDKVLICVSTTAYRYHAYQCDGLEACTHTIKQVTKKEAVGLERTPCMKCYPTAKANSSGSNSLTPLPKSSGTGCTTVQCSGTTQKGLRCKNKTANCNGRCHYH